MSPKYLNFTVVLWQTIGNNGNTIDRDCIRRLMLVMGIESLFPKPGTSKRQPEHPVYSYLLRGMTLTDHTGYGQPT